MLEGVHSEEVHILLTPSLSSIFRVFMKREVGHISSTAHTSLLELNQYNELNWTGMPFYSTKIQLFYLCIVNLFVCLKIFLTRWSVQINVFITVMGVVYFSGC